MLSGPSQERKVLCYIILYYIILIIFITLIILWYEALKGTCKVGPSFLSLALPMIAEDSPL